jgi:hypothetical protein
MGGPGSGRYPKGSGRPRTTNAARKNLLKRGQLPSPGKPMSGRKRTFYERHSKSWVTQSLDRRGIQVGDAEFSHNKPKGIKKLNEKEFSSRRKPKMGAKFKFRR